MNANELARVSARTRAHDREAAEQDARKNAVRE